MRWTRRTDAEMHTTIRVEFHPSVPDAAYALAFMAELEQDAFDAEREDKALAVVSGAGKETVRRALVDLFSSHGRNSENWSEIAIEDADTEGYPDRLIDAAEARILELWPELQ